MEDYDRKHQDEHSVRSVSWKISPKSDDKSCRESRGKTFHSSSIDSKNPYKNQSQEKRFSLPHRVKFPKRFNFGSKTKRLHQNPTVVSVCNQIFVIDELYDMFHNNIKCLMIDALDYEKIHYKEFLMSENECDLIKDVQDKIMRKLWAKKFKGENVTEIKIIYENISILIQRWKAYKTKCRKQTRSPSQSNGRFRRERSPDRRNDKIYKRERSRERTRSRDSKPHSCDHRSHKNHPASRRCVAAQELGDSSREYQLATSPVVEVYKKIDFDKEKPVIKTESQVAAHADTSCKLADDFSFAPGKPRLMAEVVSSSEPSMDPRITSFQDLPQTGGVFMKLAELKTIVQAIEDVGAEELAKLNFE